MAALQFYQNPKPCDFCTLFSAKVTAMCKGCTGQFNRCHPCEDDVATGKALCPACAAHDDCAFCSSYTATTGAACPACLVTKPSCGPCWREARCHMRWCLECVPVVAKEERQVRHFLERERKSDSELLCSLRYDRQRDRPASEYAEAPLAAGDRCRKCQSTKVNAYVVCSHCDSPCRDQALCQPCLQEAPQTNYPLCVGNSQRRPIMCYPCSTQHQMTPARLAPTLRRLSPQFRCHCCGDSRHLKHSLLMRCCDLDVRVCALCYKNGTLTDTLCLQCTRHEEDKQQRDTAAAALQMTS